MSEVNVLGHHGEVEERRTVCKVHFKKGLIFMNAKDKISESGFDCNQQLLWDFCLAALLFFTKHALKDVARPSIHFLHLLNPV